MEEGKSQYWRKDGRWGCRGTCAVQVPSLMLSLGGHRLAESDGIKRLTWVRVIVLLVSHPADAPKYALHFISFHFISLRRSGVGAYDYSW